MQNQSHYPTPPLGLIFDMDGTMIDSMPSHAESWRVFCRRHGIDMPLDEVLRRTTGRTAVECMSELFGRPVSREEALPYVHEKESIYRELFEPQFREVAGFQRFVALAVQRAIPWGIGTAGDRHNIRFALGNLRMAHAPVAVVGGDQGLRGKPEPDIFLAVAQGLGVAPEHCVVFEDAPFGIEAARRAGMRAVALCTSHPAHELLGDHVIAQAAHYDGLLTLPAIRSLLSLPHP